MDPFLKIWMFEHWLEDYHEVAEQNKHLSYSIGSFSNPQAVRDLMNRENNSYVADDAEFEDISKKIVESNRRKDEANKPFRRRKRNIIKA